MFQEITTDKIVTELFCDQTPREQKVLVYFIRLTTNNLHNYLYHHSLSFPPCPRTTSPSDSSTSLSSCGLTRKPVLCFSRSITARDVAFWEKMRIQITIGEYGEIIWRKVKLITYSIKLLNSLFVYCAEVNLWSTWLCRAIARHVVVTR